MLTDFETVRNSLQQHGLHAQRLQALQSGGRGRCSGCDFVPLTEHCSCVVSHQPEKSHRAVHTRLESQRRTSCTPRGFSVTGLKASTKRGPMVMLKAHDTPALPRTNTTCTLLGLSQPREAHLLCRASESCTVANFTVLDACAMVRSMAALPVRGLARSTWAVYCVNGLAHLRAAYRILCAHSMPSCQHVAKRFAAWAS